MIFNGIDLMTEKGREDFTKKHGDNFVVEVEKDGSVSLIGIGRPSASIWFDKETNMLSTDG